MINLQSAMLSYASVHYVGNQGTEETLFLSNDGIDLDNEFLAAILAESFTKPFADKSEFFKFTHTSDLAFNEVYSFATEAFGDFDSFHAVSQKMAKHLYEKTTHPKVKGGELYIVLFENCLLEDELCDGIGIYKTENKDVFLKAEEGDGNYQIEPELGVNLNKIDKGCFIFNSEKNDGYRVVVIDNLNKGYEAQYWKDDFLALTPHENAYHYTRQYLAMTKDFVVKALPKERETDRTEQIDMLNRSISYFKENESFSLDTFAETVMQDEGTKDAFKQYRAQYQSQKNVELTDNFDISDAAVKKQSKVFKSVLKLDKNFHVYIHGDKDLIEKGTDSDGRKFYKLYYDNEA